MTTASAFRTPENPESSARPNSSAELLGLLAITTMLIAFGLTMLYSASFTSDGAKYFNNQLIWVFLGAAGGGMVASFGFRRVARFRMLWLLICWILLITAAFFFAPIKGASRWIRFPVPGLGQFSIQPSEFTKIVLCFFVASYCAEFPRTFTFFKHRNGIIPLGIAVAVTGGLVLAGKDLGTTLLILTSAACIMFTAGLLWRYIIMGLLGIAGVVLYILTHDAVRLGRVLSFSNPQQMAQGKGYQLWNSLLALGSGGWFGMGFGQSRLKTRYLPEQHTDFILSVVGEELGLAAIWMVILFYLAWGYFAFRISLKSQSRLGMLLGVGLTIAIEVQAMINLAVISGSAPTKGMPAPFISYGGSNLAASMIAVGALASIAMETSWPGYSDNLIGKFKRRFKRK